MPTSTLADAQRFSMQSRATGRGYDISLARPLPMAGTAERPGDCPVLIVLDAALCFGTAVERSAMYAALGVLQPSVIVGVGYPGDVVAALRARTPDMTPPTPKDAHPDMVAFMGDDYGGADDFLDFLLGDLLAEVRQRAPEASATRVMLHGFSLGGLFAAYALLRRPQAFEVVSTIAPSLWWNGFAVLQHFADFEQRMAAAAHKPRVLVGVGALEQQEPQHAPPGMTLEDLQARVRQARMVDAAREFAERLRHSLPEVQYAAFEGEDHAGALTAGTGRAISFALGLDTA